MIEFTLNRNRNGKKSRWAKRYPRKRILKRGSEKAAGWYFHNWYDDGYHYFLRSSFLVHSTSQLVYTNQERLQSM